MRIIFRTSSHKQTKKKLKISAITCLKNLKKVFKNVIITVVGDGLSIKEIYQYKKIVGDNNFIEIDYKNNSKSLKFCIDLALDLKKSKKFKVIKSDKEQIYFVENDYIHLPGAKKNLIDAFNLKVHYVSLYDHPDNYDNLRKLIDFRQALDNKDKKVLIGKYSHWATTFSTTCTFAVKKGTLKNDYRFFEKMCKKDIPRDHKIFTQLTNRGRILVVPIPSLSTHIETNYLAPLIDWKKKIKYL
ncbi:MAG: hypothetical protein CBC96_04205 [Pelagibacteraceae bacterium TMED136]|mgnify:CR=1 FL=1|nr:MAG: hypothetical protein CBC96_04205 [Pelagibacteraceae bacterium TMED136]OUW02025.1 MAG: hypothetical protein CBD16_04635 [Betaproteobacteria bacterium TMED156]|tara:strand:- start:331 stop:1059 length:729 start_codon:yes stop_codon:yes gene_type:complete